MNSCGRVTEMGRQNQKTLTSWVLGTLRREKKRIQRSTLELFLSYAGSDMENIANELEKLLCSTIGSDVIRREDVEAVCTVTVESKIFDMFNQLCQIKELRAQGLDQEAIAQKMGVQSFIVRKGLSQAAYFEKETLLQAVKDCVEAETAVKTGRMGDQLAVEMILVKYSARE